MLGIVISSYGDSQQDTVDFGSSTSTVTSEQVAFYIDKKLGAFSLGTRFGYSRDRHEIENFDDFSGSHDSAAFDGRTLELAQRIGLPQEHEGFTLTPWAELAYEREDSDSFTIGNPYFDDQTYSADPVTDTLGSIGLDVRLDPFQLGGPAGSPSSAASPTRTASFRTTTKSAPRIRSGSRTTPSTGRIPAPSASVSAPAWRWASAWHWRAGWVSSTT